MSSQVRLQPVSSGVFALHGDLNMYSVPDLEGALERLLSDDASDLTLDLGAVSRSDSAGLAMLVEWWRQARQRGIDLRFSRLPEQLREIARISDLLPILPLDGDKSAAPPLQ
ncbi:MAG TPA: anti-sigma factor antagonist [Chromatiales bacterium]|nr:anti-sigma factor antagonist [Chromatiales bacterium]